MKRGLKYALAAAAALYLLTRKKKYVTHAPIKDRYVPYSDEAKALFREAATYAGLPESWAEYPGLHYILQNESGGWVGRPNYTFNYIFGKNFNQPSRQAEWYKAWNIIALDETYAQAKARHPKFTSRASGLGQLQPGNTKKFYPDKLKGVADPLNEAVGMLRYIKSRYGSPQVARSAYGKGGKGDKAFHYTHAVTGKNKAKTFKEGY
jgi:hypothetical protein